MRTIVYFFFKSASTNAKMHISHHKFFNKASLWLFCIKCHTTVFQLYMSRKRKNTFGHSFDAVESKVHFGIQPWEPSILLHQ